MKYTYINGLEDDDIKEALGWDNLDTSSLAECIAHVEKREMVRDALKKESVVQAAGIAVKDQTPVVRNDPRLRKKVKCGGCTEIIAQFAVNRNGAVGERKLCAECWRQSRKSHNMKTCGDKKPETTSRQNALEDPIAMVQGQQTTHNAIMISAVSAENCSASVSAVVVTKKTGKAFTLDHHIFSDDKGWLKRKSDPAPNLMLQLSVNGKDYRELGLPAPGLRGHSRWEL